jgi:hypothetical protein
MITQNDLKKLECKKLSDLFALMVKLRKEGNLERVSRINRKLSQGQRLILYSYISRHKIYFNYDGYARHFSRTNGKRRVCCDY